MKKSWLVLAMAGATLVGTLAFSRTQEGEDAGDPKHDEQRRVSRHLSTLFLAVHEASEGLGREHAESDGRKVHQTLAHRGSNEHREVGDQQVRSKEQQQRQHSAMTLDDCDD